MERGHSSVTLPPGASDSARRHGGLWAARVGSLLSCAAFSRTRSEGTALRPRTRRPRCRCRAASAATGSATRRHAAGRAGPTQCRTATSGRRRRPAGPVQGQDRESPGPRSHRHMRARSARRRHSNTAAAVRGRPAACPCRSAGQDRVRIARRRQRLPRSCRRGRLGSVGSPRNQAAASRQALRRVPGSAGPTRRKHCLQCVRECGFRQSGAAGRGERRAEPGLDTAGDRCLGDDDQGGHPMAAFHALRMSRTARNVPASVPVTLDRPVRGA